MLRVLGRYEEAFEGVNPTFAMPSSQQVVHQGTQEDTVNGPNSTKLNRRFCTLREQDRWVGAAGWFIWDSSHSNQPSIGGSFTLIDQDRRTFTDADLEGKPSLIYFGYTFCLDVRPTTLLLGPDGRTRSTWCSSPSIPSAIRRSQSRAMSAISARPSKA
jgi:hypothetical protein